MKSVIGVFKVTLNATPWYYRILLPPDSDDFRRIANKPTSHDSKLTIHTSFDRGGIKLCSVGRNKLSAITHVWANLRKVEKCIKTKFTLICTLV